MKGDTPPLHEILLVGLGTVLAGVSAWKGVEISLAAIFAFVLAIYVRVSRPTK